jgi:hypothetical protein
MITFSGDFGEKVEIFFKAIGIITFFAQMAVI